jgi:hypothetical protein
VAPGNRPGNPSSGARAGYIQFVVGSRPCAALPIMWSRKARPRSGRSEAGQQPHDLDLDIVALVEAGGADAVIALGDGMIGRRGGVAEHHFRLAFQEQAIGLGPAGGDRQDARGQRFPDCPGLGPEDMVDPQHQAQPRGRRSRILDHDRQIRGGKSGEACGRVGHDVGIVDKSEGAPVKRQEQRIVPIHRKIEIGGRAMRGKEPGFRRCRGQRGVEAQHHIGARTTVEPQPCQQRRAIAGGDKAQIAATDRLEPRFDRGPGSPIRGETVIGQHAQDRAIPGGGRQGRAKQAERDGSVSHGSPP